MATAATIIQAKLLIQRLGNGMADAVKLQLGQVGKAVDVELR